MARQDVDDEAVRKVGGWFAGLFPGAKWLATQEGPWAFDREFWIFTATREGRTIAAVHISAEALERVSPADLIAMMHSAGLPGLVTRDATMRILVTGLQPIVLEEQAPIVVDDRFYTVTRDVNHSVRILDRNGVALTNIPPEMRTRSTTIFARDPHDWMADVRRLMIPSRPRHRDETP